jgi:class 3 adenylate cyclase
MRRAVLFGVSEGTMMSAFFAAAHPERVSHLVLYGGMPRQPVAPDFPIGYPEGSAKAFFGNWGDGSFTTKYLLPSWRDNPELVRQAARFERQSCSPGNLRAFVKMNADLDVRHIASEIRVPTLVLHRNEDQLVPVALGRWYGDNIPGARMIVYPGSGHWPPTFNEDWHTLVADLQEFVTGTRGAHGIEAERVLATVLFTDIAGSTGLANELGDVVWRRKLDEHDRLARKLVEQHRGRFVKGTGDGVLAIFDGPGRAIRCALALTAGLAQLQLTIRAGLHAGEIELRDDDISGIGVHTAARVMDQANAGEVLVSGIVADLVAGSGIAFSERGQHALKGLPGIWRLLAALPER